MTTEEWRKLSLQTSITEKEKQQKTMFNRRLKYPPRSELRRLCVQYSWWFRHELNDFRVRLAKIQ
ncbi:hypothetical protein FDG95_gp394 [Pectobacterium phage vB_PcaM_CBB]|uniref:Uncharacterized protein n=1 Tax=Pectobacterium phage vB_PcaM_CBB TaxID=2772511 RepID=A0A1L2CUD7_9CAUD|nr:hypothetical protein FDG95_gp032 [Pectobacterium phage vB_PcaM_CBB]YP_009595125.1 hypothetical protein FDG95_gp394 [Pectobacterium phage vB_PcaM_CBB]AMM43597.1 hypothetical protein CBB_585 [Pectobacterium phage vB_PcaM_CBB]AMM44148.1 hypothetical protein CBB_32 [Pectobacterium phage vB_PcaM_CBB]